MANSIADRYRTRFPPKEHEEAVRMLLDGVEKQQVEEIVNNRKRLEDKRKMTNNHHHHHQVKSSSNQTPRTKQADDSSFADRKSLNSSSTATETNSSSGIVEFNDTSHNTSTDSGEVGSVQSKSTSTSESISSGSARDSEKSTGMVVSPMIEGAVVQSGDLIPSRTIAVQCDLKWSSVKSRDALFDTSMQASSISSTKYGFYSFNYETLTKRHRLQRSTSYKNLDATGNNNTTDYRGRQQFATEAPTSMSELSESEASQGEISRSHSRATIDDRRAPTDEGRPLPAKEVPKNHARLSANGCQMYSSVLDNSKSTARARINSLPRRPKTALSYVSANKLRQQQQSDSESSDFEDDDYLNDDRRREARRGLRRSKKFNSVSHQNLARPKTLASNGNHHQLSSSTASSDSELARPKTRTTPSDNYTARSVHNRSHNDLDGDDDDNYQDDDEENRRSEEMILLNGGHRTGTRDGQRPQLVEARHQEDVQDLDGMLEQFRRAESELRNNGAREKRSTLRPGATPVQRVATRDPHQERGRFVGSTMSLPRKAIRRSQQPSDEDVPRPLAPEYPLEQYKDDEGGHIRGDLSSQRAYEAKRQAQVGRSTSMRQISGRPSALRRYERSADGEKFNSRNQNRPTQPEQTSTNTLTRNRSHTMRPLSGGTRAAHRPVNEDNSDAMESKTWSNPAAGVTFRAGTQMAPIASAADDMGASRNMVTRKVASRSMSMRDINEARRGGASTTYTPYKSNSNFAAKYNDECSSSDSSDLVADENVVRNLAARLSPLDYDSQQRLNKSGLPEVNATVESNGAARATSYLGSSRNHHYHHHVSQDGLQQQHRYLSSTLNGRGGQIKGRALSQQSLTRPTMPLSASGRRWQTTGSNSASSDVGGSSMSLATRLHGRYESAHTRTPIVMYIPPASSSSRASSLKGDDSLLGGSRLQRSTLKRGSRSPRNRSRHGSQDRGGSTAGRRQRSQSRNGSDSETSSILRSLVRPRGSRESAYSSKRIARMQNIPVNNMIDTDEENMDGVGRLATEVDSYKFTRRYSVPKDAKINWFSRLRQRVASGNR